MVEIDAYWAMGKRDPIPSGYPFKRMDWMSTRVVDPDRDGIWQDWDDTLEWVQANVERPGYLLIDWEGPFLSKIAKATPPAGPFGLSVSQAQIMATVLRHHYPDLKIGFYGIPPRELIPSHQHERRLAYGERCNALRALRPYVDFFAPTLYQFYEGRDEEDISEYGFIVEQAMSIAGDREVIPVISPRFHVAGHPGFAFQHEDEFRHVHQALISPAFGQASIDGYVMWGWEWGYITGAFSTVVDPNGVARCGGYSWAKGGQFWETRRAALLRDMTPEEQKYLLCEPQRFATGQKNPAFYDAAAALHGRNLARAAKYLASVTRPVS